MKVLHTNMLRGWGGQSNRILVEALGALRAGHDVRFAVPHGSRLAEKGRDAGIHVYPGFQFKPPAQLWRFLPDLLRFRRLLREWTPDLIHVHGSQDTWLVAIARTLSPRSFPPVIRTKHNIFEWSMHPGNRWMLRRVDAYISISSYIDRQLDSYPPVRDRPRTRIPSVPDLDAIRQQHPSLRHEIPGLNEGMFLWGSTGRLRSEKGFDLLLRAFARVREKRTDAFLAIAGDGSDRAPLESQARNLGLTGNAVAFLGFRRDVPALLKSLDAYVLASRAEGLGTAILEALAAGLPVVATNVGGIPDSVRDNETGLLVPPEDPPALANAMLKLMDDAPLRRRLGDNAQRIIETEFTEQRLVEKTLEFYTQIAALRR